MGWYKESCQFPIFVICQTAFIVFSGIWNTALKSERKTLGFERPVEHENPKEICVSTRADIRSEDAESSTVIIIIVTFPETNTFRQPI